MERVYLYCSQLGEFNARVSRKWEARVKAIGGWREEGLVGVQASAACKGKCDQYTQEDRRGPQEWVCKAAVHTLYKDQIIYL